DGGAAGQGIDAEHLDVVDGQGAAEIGDGDVGEMGGVGGAVDGADGDVLARMGAGDDEGAVGGHGVDGGIVQFADGGAAGQRIDAEHLDVVHGQGAAEIGDGDVGEMGGVEGAVHGADGDVLAGVGGGDDECAVGGHGVDGGIAGQLIYAEHLDVIHRQGAAEIGDGDVGEMGGVEGAVHGADGDVLAGVCAGHDRSAVGGHGVDGGIVQFADGGASGQGID